MELEEAGAAGQIPQEEKKQEKPEPEISVDDYKKLVMQMRKTNLMIQQISGIPLGELTMLLTISHLSKENGEAKVSCLGDLMKLSKPAVSRTLHILEKKGYIEMKNGEKDQRYLFVRPVKKGMQCLEEELEDGYEILERVKKRMGEKEMCDFLHSYGHFHSLLTEEIIRLNKEKGIRPV
ncbi:MAG: MarR family transcriptional regulator [Eubacteriales bacterium]|nr:MarR family transcriptional regulator [Eubacteriales bacterium]